MKLTLVLLTAAILNVSAKGLSQTITFSGKNISLEKVFDVVKKQTNYEFFYKLSILKDSKPITVTALNVPLDVFLREVLKGQPIEYAIENKNIIINRKPVVTAPKLVLDISIFTAVNVKGKIVNEKGESVAGATIVVKGTNRMAISGVNGEFELNGIASNAVLVITNVGFEEQEVLVKGRTDITVRLKIKTGALDEVSVQVSTGFQQLPKERATGSFVQINNELLNRKVGGSVLDRIYDVTSGLLKVNKTEGFEVRGISTINASKNALIVLDNFPISGNINQVNQLNPNDIESVTVLKDAAAASIWGARAGNGVIVITTKKGKFNQKPAVSVNSNVTVVNKPDLYYNPSMSSKDEIDFEKMRFNRGDYNAYDDTYPGQKTFTALPPVAELLLAVRRGKLSQAQADAQIALYENHDVRTDIDKYFQQKAVMQQYALNIRGGVANYNYFASVGYDQNRATSVGQQDNRVSIYFNNTYKPIKNLDVNGFMAFNKATVSTPNAFAGSFMPGNNTAPYTMLADAQGQALAIPHIYRTAFVDTTNAPGMLDWHYRPLDELRNADNRQITYDIRVGGGLKYAIIPGLSAEVKYQYEKLLIDTRNNQNVQNYDTRSMINTVLSYNPATKLPVYPVPLGGIINLNNTDNTIINIRGQINYDKRFGDHDISVIAGSDIREDKRDARGNRIYGFQEGTYVFSPVDPTKSFPTRFNYSTNIADGKSLTSDIGRYGSYFGNASYTFMDRYTVSGSGRVDQSNFFGVKANQRIAPLWSSGLAWDLSREKFYHADWLPHLKFRATYGFNGNTSGGNAYATAGYSTSTIVGVTVPTATIRTPNNPGLTWEKVRIINYAVEAASKDNRISGSFEYYFKKGIDLIGPIDMDPTSGFLSFTGNTANIKGRGFDLTINTRNLKGKLQWNTNFLLSYNTDKVTAYGQVPNVNSYLGEQTPIIGSPLYKLYSYRWAGLNGKTGEPLLYLSDTASSYTNMLKAKPSDLVYNGNLLPRYFGSVLNTFRYKDFSLSFNILFRFDYVFRRQSIAYNSLYAGWGGHADYANRWQKPGDELRTNVPSIPTTTFRSDNYSLSDILVEKGDLIRLQDIRLDYTFDRSKIRKLPMQSVQVYLYANNIGLLWTANKKGIDPDYISGIPIARSIAGGLTINF